MVAGHSFTMAEVSPRLLLTLKLSRKNMFWVTFKPKVSIFVKVSVVSLVKQ